MSTIAARDLAAGHRIHVGLDDLTVSTAERGRIRNRHVVHVFFKELASTGNPYRTTFGLNERVPLLDSPEPEVKPTLNPYVEKYGTPDEPAFVGQVIDSGGEFQFLPDGTLVLSESLGHTYRVVQRLNNPNREVIVARRDGSVTPIPEERFTTTDRDLSMLRLRVIYVPTDV